MLKTPFSQLPEMVQLEIRDFILEGNDIRSLADMFLEHLNVQQMTAVIKEVKRYHEFVGNAPYTSVLKVEEA